MPDILFTVEWWNWKYASNPAGFNGEEGDIWVAENDNKIVGYYAIIPVIIKLEDDTKLIAQSVDTAVHPDYRRMGIFSTLANKVYDEAKEKYSFLFGFPSEMASKGFVKLGWNEREIDEFIKFTDYKITLKYFFKNSIVIYFCTMLLKTLALFSKLKSMFINVKKMNIEIQEVDTFPKEIDEFWKEYRSENDVILKRDYKFLNWRFSKIFGDYKIYVGRSEKNRIVGYAVFRKNKIGKFKNILDVVDFISLPKYEYFISDIINIALNYNERENLNVIHCRVPSDHTFSKILYKYGFVKINKYFSYLHLYKPRAIFYNLTDRKKRIILGNWFYTLADTDYA